MKKLVDIHKEKESELKNKLMLAKNSQQMIEIIQNELTGLADNSNYIDRLTPSQARIAVYMLELVKTSYNTLIATIQQDSTSGQEDLKKDQLKFESHSESKMLGRKVTIAGVASGTIAGGMMGGPPGAVVGAVSGAVVGEGFRRTLKSTNIETIEPIVRPEKSYQNIDIDSVLSNLHQAFETIDLFVVDYGSELKEAVPKPSIEDHPELLEFLQNLIGDSLDEKDQIPKFTRKRLEELPAILKFHGIEVKVYQPDKEQLSEFDEISMFDFEHSLDPKNDKYITLCPAFIKDGQVILRGRVVRPANDAI